MKPAVWMTWRHVLKAPLDGATPVLDDDEFERRRKQILSALGRT